jgi:hypothetical protein
MKKDNITRFMQAHRQHIEDDGFSEKLAAQCKYYPRAQKVDTRRITVALIVPCCSLLAVWLVSLLGGWRIFFETLMGAINSTNPYAYILYVLLAAILMLLLILPVRLKDSL